MKVGAAEHVTMQMTNCVVTADEFQFDYMILNDGDQPVKLNSAAFRITHSPAIVPSGTHSYSLSYVGGSDFPDAFLTPGVTYNVSYTPATQLMQMVMSNGNYNSITAVSIPIGGPAKKVGRFSLKITSGSWTTGSAVGLSYHSNGNGIVVFLNGSTVSSIMNQTTPSIFTLDTLCALTIPSSCGITSSASNIVPVTCYAGNNGSATVSLSNASIPVSWILNGNPIAGSDTVITLGSLQVGNNSISFTDASNCTGIQTFVISGPSDPLSLAACSFVNIGCVGSNGYVSAGVLSHVVGTPLYSWSDSLNNIVSSNSSDSLPAGTYTLTVTDDCFTRSCSGTIIQSDTITTSFMSTACDVYVLPWGVTVTNPGDYEHSYISVDGCDSIVTAHVNIESNVGSAFSDTGINVYYLPWGDSAITSGNYMHTYTTVNGCDSVVTASITIQTPTGIGSLSQEIAPLYFLDGSRIVVSERALNAKLYSLNGQEVSFSDIRSGIYMLVIESDEGIHNFKILVE